MYDYTAVAYPEGTVSADNILVFNHKQIAKIYFVGYCKNEEEKEFKSSLMLKLKAYRIAMKYNK